MSQRLNSHQQFSGHPRRGTAAVEMACVLPLIVTLLLGTWEMGRYVEVQGTGEHGTFDRALLDRLLDLATHGITDLAERQRAALSP